MNSSTAAVLVACLACLACFAVARPVDAVTFTVNDFEAYCARFGKSYQDPAEYNARKKIFQQRVLAIERQNAKGSNWSAGVNRLTDLRSHEISQLMGYSKSLARQHRLQNLQGPMPPAIANPTSLPDEVDWAAAGMTTPVKNQEQCGSCWAFAGTEAIESSVMMNTNKSIILAPQAFVDCVENPNHCGGTGGCEGATAQLLYNYTLQKGADKEDNYPYKGKDGTCRSYSPAATITGFLNLPSNDGKSLMAAVANFGPITVSVAASSWALYSGGVFGFGDCDADINHAVLLVGYGTDEKLGAYWKIQNSWGPEWGEKGFIRLQRFTDEAPKCATDKSPADGSACEGGPSEVSVCGTCGVLYDSSFPIGGAAN